jgi:hypothetical protein
LREGRPENPYAPDEQARGEEHARIEQAQEWFGANGDGRRLRYFGDTIGNLLIAPDFRSYDTPPEVVVIRKIAAQ